MTQLTGIPNAEEDSPYPEVRSAVANYDDITMPASTLRAWFLGVCFAVVMPALNQFFNMRYPSILVGPVCIPLSVCHYHDRNESHSS